MNFGKHSSNGWLLAVVTFACEQFGWTLDYVYNSMSIIDVMLLMRQKLASEGHCGIFLEDKEMMDNTSWEELLAENKKNRK